MVTGLPRYKNQISKVSLIDEISTLGANKVNLSINILNNVYNQEEKGDYIISITINI